MRRSHLEPEEPEFYDGRAVRTSDPWLDRKVELRGLLYAYFLGPASR